MTVKILKQTCILFACLITSQFIMYYFVDDYIINVASSPIIFISGRLILAAVLWVVVNLLFGAKKSKFSIKNYRTQLVSFYIIYLVFLVSIVFFKDGVYHRQYNFTPLLNLFKHQNVNNDIFIINIISNIFMFIPLGIVALLFAKNKLFNYLQIFLYTSLFIELIQFIFKRGIFDIDDIILNTIGGFIGVYLTQKFFIKNKKSITF
jgi:glycopeptide antibiotics resistance protein